MALTRELPYYATDLPAINRAGAQQGAYRPRNHYDGGTRLAQGPVAPPVDAVLPARCLLTKPGFVNDRGRLCQKPR